jgi:radical SAM superfamily enzyme
MNLASNLLTNIKESSLERFQNLVYSDDLDIVCVNETWLSGHVYNVEILQILQDRKTRRGGVLLGIKTAVFKSVREIEHNHDLEIAMAEITTAKDMKLIICSLINLKFAQVIQKL